MSIVFRGPANLQQSQRITWPQIATLRVNSQHHTANPSIPPYQLLPNQHSPWPNFLRDMRAFTSQTLGQPFEDFQTDPFGDERVCIGNENGVIGRFMNNVGHYMDPVFMFFGIDARFGDYQTGSRPLLYPPTQRAPDVVIIDGGDRIRAVGEAKTPWTVHHFDLGRLAGQTARYMDDSRLRYGFFTTYHDTYFVRRTSDTTFQISEAVRHDTVSSANPLRVSTRETFLYLPTYVGNQISGGGPLLGKIWLTSLDREIPRFRDTPARAASRKKLQTGEDKHFPVSSASKHCMVAVLLRKSKIKIVKWIQVQTNRGN